MQAATPNCWWIRSGSRKAGLAAWAGQVRCHPMTDPTESPFFRDADREDLTAIIELLADDPLGALRELLTNPLPQSYLDAFDAISADPNNRLIVAVLGGQIAGTMQLTFLPGLSHQGSWRCQIEGVRISKSFRSQGVGRRMIEWAIGQAAERGCRFVQLTSDKTRSDALRFYENLGFKASHAGMKLRLED